LRHAAQTVTDATNKAIVDVGGQAEYPAPNVHQVRHVSSTA